ncbi:MAG: hypothetical protein R2752_09040 [Vicinamibacterales bacterium]
MNRLRPARVEQRLATEDLHLGDRPWWRRWPRGALDPPAPPARRVPIA